MHATTTSADATTTVEADIAAILDRAVAYLEEHGWRQEMLYGYTEDDKRPACAVGALNVAIFGDRVNHILSDDTHTLTQLNAVALAVADWLALDHEDNCCAIDTLIEWNDDYQRTADHVLGTFRAVADEHRHQDGEPV